MELRPTLVPRQAFEARRGDRPLPAIFQALWCCGTLDGLLRPTVAIVGTRAATAYGRGLARRFASELGAAGCCILSGLALGIDAMAHEGALAGGAPSIGVLGGGHSQFFPRRNRGLAERLIEAGGAVLSPYAPEEPARPGQFLQRNGIVAALADAVVVIEAPARSGALNTAGWAAGRIPVLAVPGDVDRPQAAGCLALIRDGVTLARDPADVLAELSLPAAQLPLAAPPRERADALERAIVRSLGDGERSLDAIVDACREPVARVSAALTLLEIDGSVQRRNGVYFALMR